MISPRLVRVLAHGGVLAPADLVGVIEASRSVGNEYVMLGSRQDILFPTIGADSKGGGQEMRMRTDLEWDLVSIEELREVGQRHNVVSSYIAANVTESTWWLKENVYQRVLDTFACGPRLKVDLVDPLQALVPLFTGHLNFVAAREEQSWHLFVRGRDGDGEVKRWPRLFRSEDLAPLAGRIEVEWAAMPELGPGGMYDRLRREFPGYDAGMVEERLPFLADRAPAYEGLNSMAGNLFWLGIYWRNNRFDIDFLSAVSRLCQETRVGKIGITPWKSLLIKGIRAKDRIRWEQLTRRYGINLRHSSLELNWHLPAMDEEALRLKTDLVRELDGHDISVHGLTFGIRTRSDAPRFTTIVIEWDGSAKLEPDRYRVLYADDSDPSRSGYRSYVEGVRREELPACLIELSRTYAGWTEPDEHAADHLEEVEGPRVDETSRHRCRDCMTVYAEEFGDPLAGFPAGTPFDALPPHYACSVCAAGKERFLARGTA